MQKIINIEQGVVRMPAWRMAEPVNFTTLDGEQIAIVGPNGGGKTMLADIITGRHPLLLHDPDKIRPLLDRDVADPWYTGDFAQTYEDIMEGCRNILEEFS